MTVSFLSHLSMNRKMIFRSEHTKARVSASLLLCVIHSFHSWLHSLPLSTSLAESLAGSLLSTTTPNDYNQGSCIHESLLGCSLINRSLCLLFNTGIKALPNGVVLVALLPLVRLSSAVCVTTNSSVTTACVSAFSTCLRCLWFLEHTKARISASLLLGVLYLNLIYVLNLILQRSTR